MAKYFRCWVIVDGAVPTSFRARDPEDLLPTLRQLQRTQPGVQLKWFERGRLWASPEAAKAALLERRRAPSTRGRDWRPGGEHKDPRARYDIPRDEKRARFKKRLIAARVRDGQAPPATGRPPAKSTRPTGRPPAKPYGRPPAKPFGRPPAASSDRPKGRSFGRKPAGPPKRRGK